MSYGLRMKSGTGAVTIDDDESLTRSVRELKVNRAYSGTITVQKFDDTQGMLFFGFYASKYSYDTDTLRVDSYTMANYYDWFVVTPFVFPTLDWDNTAKELDVTAGANPPASFTAAEHLRSSLRIGFVHFK